jgi:hypothetical protein
MKKSNLKKLVKEALDASTSAPNNIPGGLAQFATIGDLAQMHKLPLEQIIKQILKGIKIGEIAKLAPTLRSAMSHNQVTGELLNVNWVDVGTPERLAELNK